ncbi:hypothetical protein [Hymenobacter sp. AT01-02]|uniref:hypothetical protein n=1 Tax=Hymenobacter sp. AT01-02 TaxID=1571877 RepID=UPI0006E3B051|nr:hypothetical protein [Hymenobacter sp. AT01-02]
MLSSIQAPANLYSAPPAGLAVAFALITLLAVLWFWVAARRSNPKQARVLLVGLLLWMAAQGFFASLGLYQDLAARPPRLLLLAILPALLAIVAAFTTARGRRFINGLPLSTLTYLNVVRIPVELVLYGLFLAKEVPELMTFMGRNPDILVGLTAPLLGLWGFTRPRLPREVVLLWHVLALLLLLNIVFWAVVASPVPFQQVAFANPNVAVLKFPFVWLPAVVVPIVLFGHLVVLRQLSKAPVPASLAT